MSVSKFTSSSGLNDFNLNIQATNSTVTFDAEKSQGSYSVASSSNDTSIDFYAYASDGSLAGFTSNKSFTASRNFNKMVILGGTIGDVISFTFKTTYATAQETAETTAGPFITGVSPSSLPNVNSTTTVSGGNFASGITATFTGTDAVARPAKSVVVGSPQSIIVTRPDVFPTSSSPYTLVVSNPGISDPVGTASNVLSNAITAGVAPSWTTASGNIGTFSKNIPFSATVVATDADGGSSITYSVTPGYSLPAGLSIGSSSGVISGTPTVSSPVSFNLRATDSGGNYVDRSFTLSDSGPVWTTSGTLSQYGSGFAYSYQLVAVDDSGVAPTYALSTGSLPPGLSLSSSGLISGTAGASSSTYTFTINATDANGVTTTSGTLTINSSPILSGGTQSSDATYFYRTFTSGSGTLTVSGSTVAADILVVAGGGSGGNDVGGGGGAGGVIYYASNNLTVGSHSVTVGNGGIQTTSGTSAASATGGNSSFDSITAFGGGPGANWVTNYVAQAGGCGGGGAGYSSLTQNAGSTQTSNNGGTGYGNAGGTGSANAGGGGGGAGAVGQSGSGNNAGAGGSGLNTWASWAPINALSTSGYVAGGGGSASDFSTTIAGAGGAGGGGAGGTGNASGPNAGSSVGVSGTPYTGGGGGGANGYPGGAGGSGIVVIRYLKSAALA